MRHVLVCSGGARRASLAIGSMTGLLVTAGSVAVAAPGAAATPSIRVFVHGGCVEGHDHRAGGSVQVVQERGGSTIATRSFDVSSSARSTCGFKPILVGDVLVVQETVASVLVIDRS